MQSITSAKTSLKQVPALFKKPIMEQHRGSYNLDLGGGAYDLGTKHLNESWGIHSRVLDPFNRSAYHNDKVREFFAGGNADTVTCCNVLNVIKEQTARFDVIAQAATYVKENGTVYFQIYEGDRKGTGRETTKGWQNNRTTFAYIPEIAMYFNKIKKRGNLIICENPKQHTRRAA